MRTLPPKLKSLARRALRRGLREVGKRPRLRAALLGGVRHLPFLERRLRDLAARLRGDGVPMGARLTAMIPEPLRPLTLPARRVLADIERLRRQPAGDAPRARLRLACVSPLPPLQSGIADYTAQLLPELVRYYDVELVSDQETVSDPFAASLPRRSSAWFHDHAHEYDRILYHLGNSHFHAHMYALLEAHPGVVVLHDIYLSAGLHYLDHSGGDRGAFGRALFASHGYPALLRQKEAGHEAMVWEYPCSKPALDRATGVIVHSGFARELAARWYGADYVRDWRVVPLLPSFPQPLPRNEARQRLGLEPDTFVVCSFGLLGPTKLNHLLLQAWLDSALARDPRCRLVFVGANHPGEYGRALSKAIAAGAGAERIRITGYASHEDYLLWLSAADAAVQLRRQSRGESSGATYDCLANGVPTIVNAHGASAELPSDAVIMLPEEVNADALRPALERLLAESGAMRDMGARAAAWVRARHAPEPVCRLYREAIETFAREGHAADYHGALRQAAAADGDLGAQAAALALRFAPPGPARLFIDVSALVHTDLGTGIQRVVRSICNVLLRDPPAGYRVEPVFDAGGRYLYAREFTFRLLGLPAMPVEDAPVDFRAGDVFLGLDLLLHVVASNHALLRELSGRGVRLWFTVYDLLPVLRPDVFPPGTDAEFARWLATVTEVSEGLVCISRAVADELEAWIAAHPPSGGRRPRIGWFHLGSDIAASLPSRGMSPGDERLLAQLRRRPTLLMVGTVEPRKGHAQALAAFDLLWRDGVEVNLAIVGKQGWMMEALAQRLRTHPERGRRLFWLEGISDELLEQAYGASAGLLAPSEGEGFGLPLIEGARHGLPLVVRDLPVFREVAGDHATYFSGSRPEDLAQALRAWLGLLAADSVPDSSGLRWLTWEQSARQLMDAVLPVSQQRLPPPD